MRIRSCTRSPRRARRSDKAINILQGRCVGGGTTVNWTSSFRTPAATLAFWQREFGLTDFTVDAMAPWFAKMEERLSIAPWTVAPNANNEALARGARKIGIAATTIRRNVKGCWNLGLLRDGLPDQRQAIDARHHDTGRAGERAPRSLHARARSGCVTASERVTALEAFAMDADGVTPTARRSRFARMSSSPLRGRSAHLRCCCAAARPIRMRWSGKRTFLHPSVVSAALMPERVDGFAGRPQSIYSDHFLDTQPIDGPIGYKLEAPPCIRS